MSVNRFNPIIGVLAIGLLFSGCGKSEPDTPTPTPGPSTVAVTGVTVGSASLSLTEGGTGTISYTISPSNATNQGVSFKSSDPSVASVDGTGKVTAGKPGTASITVTTSDGGKTATCTVTVTAKTVAVTGVKLDKTTLELAVGASQKLTASVEPSNATNKEVTWKSSDDKVATVGTDGTVTGVKAGTVTISVTTKDGSKTATCKVTVTAKTVAVTGVTLNKSTVSIVIGETFKLVPTVKPDDATNKEVTWKSSNTAVATVAEDGTITAVKAGTATITCTTKDGAKKATCAVTVTSKAVAVTGVTLNKSKISITVGETFKLEPTISPSNATNKEVEWKSSNTAVATVAEDGTVTAVKAGTATITCTTKDGAKKATCSVEVKTGTVAVTGVTLDKEKITVIIGTPQKLTATVKPDNATNKEVTWSSSNTSVATVGTDGTVKGVKTGTATITCTTKDGSKKATCSVTVYPKPDSVWENGKTTNGEIAEGATIMINNGDWYTYLPYSKSSNVIIKDGESSEFSATSSNTTVGRVEVYKMENYYGWRISAHKAGTATITLTYRGFKRQVTLNVIDIVPRDKSGNDIKSSMTVTKTTNGTESLHFRFYDYAAKQYITFTNDNYKDFTIVSSNHDVVSNTVSWNASYRGVNLLTAGKATLTFYYKNVIIAQTQLTVNAATTVAVTGVTLDKTSLTLSVDGTYKLVPTVSPSNASDKEVTWSSSNTSVATVGTDGTVKGVKAGTATITCTTKDQGKKATCTVTVNPKPQYTAMVPGTDNLPAHRVEINGSKSYYLNMGSADHVIRLYDKAINDWVSVTSGMSIKSANTSIATGEIATLGTGSNTTQAWRIKGVKRGTTTVELTYGTFSQKITVIVGNYEIHRNKAKVSSVSYELGSAEDGYLRFQLYDKDLKDYVNVSYLQNTIISDESVIVYPGVTDYEYFLRPIKKGSAKLTFRDGLGSRIGTDIAVTVTSPNYTVYYGDNAVSGTITYTLRGLETELVDFRIKNNSTGQFITGAENLQKLITISSSNEAVASNSYASSDKWRSVIAYKQGLVTLTFKYKGFEFQNVSLRIQ